MVSQELQDKINKIVQELYISHDLVSRQMFLNSMFSYLRVYFIYLHKEKNNEYTTKIIDAYTPQILEEDGKLHIASILDNDSIYQEHFIKEFCKNVDYGIYTDEDEIGHFITEFGEVQIYESYIKVSTNNEEFARSLMPYVIPDVVSNEKSVNYNLVVQSQKGFESVTGTSTRNIDIDIKKNYNDDLPYDKYKEFCEKAGSGLALLFGSPGTGKSTLLKKLMFDCSDTDFYIMDFSMLQNIVSGQFLSFLLSLKNAVIVMEDCEFILRKRSNGDNPLINSLLNITDGLIGDTLNIRFLCTFNAPLTDIDEALLRPGRLKIKYEFKALDAKKTKELCGDNKSETLAEIYNRDKIDYGEKKVTKIGF